eukprot:TRINITY_DN1309_c0_g1_i2.p1 TRINITY_DN1309_c0_g1~~TRINITY_DN1309_c0_g1_i2.p1  ORF type:complete len:157 (+),score=20.88 TRINITY_DN1309_c0_g1_i2:16-486(+)
MASARYASQKPPQYKLVLLGEAGVGKSNLVLRYVQGQYQEHQESTIGASYLSHNLTIDDQLVKLDIWDTAGQERYRALAPMYYRSAHAAVIVYDVTNPDTFEKAKDWVKELHQTGANNVVIAIAGNKIDLESIVDAEVLFSFSFPYFSWICGDFDC